MPASPHHALRSDSSPALRAPRSLPGLTLADATPSPVRWRHVVGWLRKV